MLIPGYRSQGRVQVFCKKASEGALAQESLAEVLKFAPQAIAGTLEQLEAAAATAITLSHAIVVMGKWEDARVTEADREKLWMRFRVPVFEQIIAGDGALLAAECEAHNGLHLEAEALRPDTLRPYAESEIDRSPCLCGRTGPRLITVEGAVPRQELVRSVVMYAR